MATIEQLSAALVKADAAGDTAAARALAAELRRVRSAQPPVPATAPASAAVGNTFTDGVKGAAAGAGLGFSNVVFGAQRLFGKGLAAMDDILPGKTPNSSLGRLARWVGDDADERKADAARANAPYKAASPLMNATGEVAGGIVATLPVGGLLPKAALSATAAKGVAGILPRAGLAAGAGAAYGGVSGATGSNADTFGGMLADGAVAAGTGALTGGLSTPAIATAGAVSGNIAQRFSKTRAADFAKQKIAEAFSRDARGTLATGGHINPLSQMAARFSKLGDEAVLADAGGRNTNQLLDTLATLPGRTKEQAYNMLHRRTAGVGYRMRAAAEEALDTQGQRLPSTVDSLIARRQRDSTPLYNQLRQTDITPSPDLADIVKAADDLGATKIGREIATARQMPFTLDSSAPSRWNMGDLDHVKQGIDQVLASRKALNQDGTLTPVGLAYQALKTRLIGALDDATTNRQTGESLYRKAREAFAEPSRLIDAGKAGQMAINRDEGSILSMMRGMSDNELQAFRIGAFEGLRAKLGTQGGQTNIMNMWKEPATKEKLQAIFGSERAYRQFASSVAKEAQLKRLQSVGAGSQTAARQAGMGDLDMAALTEAGAAVGAAKTGNLLTALGSAKNVWNRVALPQAVRDQMGNMLLSRGGEGAHTLNSLAPLIQSINSRNMLLSNRVGVLGGNVSSTLMTPALPVQQIPR
ncbi:hypothetical protein [Massilia sp. LC238]|uniref:hypothetical protein n=1 Tax=Massilia sp. LC238 TaxID=1502852 RepID=UPI0004E35DE1|nr:hypothetical protein [Massilia sp. LC238]KFC61961.1 hypothetical protein FG94_05001 [Massilia sp. LC238]